jgi:two-component system, chemotaxis family, protein-glutamate methylesterase/glutaminase
MSSSTRPWFVAIGASGAEGLSDIKELLAWLPVPIPAVVLVVLHRPWDKPSHLREVLSRGCAHPILIAEEGEKFTSGTIYIGEPAQHLTLVANSFGSLVDDPQREHRNRTVDLLFRSVAEYGRGRVIGVVLSGSLDDGSRGLAAVHHGGGVTMVLTPHPLPTGGMARNAAAYDGPIDLVGTPRQIAEGIMKTIRTAASR